MTPTGYAGSYYIIAKKLAQTPDEYNENHLNSRE
jgi:hypothetical protein